MIKIYGSSNCKWCKAAVDVAERYQLKYEYIDAMENVEEFSAKFPGAKTVPQITWNENVVGGYSDFVLEIENTRTFGDGKL